MPETVEEADRVVKAPVDGVVAPIVVELMVEPVTVSKLPPVNVKLEDVAITPEPLPNRRSFAVKLEAPVPPLATGRIPETSEVKEAAPIYKPPLPSLRTLPAPKEVMVVEPVTTNFCPGVVVPMPTLPLFRILI